MINKVVSYIRKYSMIQEGDIVAAGVSGGADSVCLLLMLLEYKKKCSFDIIVVHVNHGIRGAEADADAEYVRRLCEDYEIPFVLKEADVPALAAEWKMSEEEAGRRVRYEAFREVLETRKGLDVKKVSDVQEKKHSKIAVAHHQGDRAETMLFHLFRGTGVQGMAGMLPINGEIIRPLLCVSREEIEEWLTEKGIRWCIDSTNGEDTYTRNKIRHHILEYAEREINTRAVSHAAEAAEQLAQMRAYLEEEVKKAAGVCVRKEEKGLQIQLPKLKTYPVFLQKQLLLRALSQMAEGGRDIAAVHIQAMLELCEKEGSKQLHLPGNVEVRKEYDVLRIILSESEVMAGKEKRGRISAQQSAEAGEGAEISLTEERSYLLPGGEILEVSFPEKKDIQIFPEKKYTKYLDYDKINSCLSLRSRQQGDYLTVTDAGGTKTLKEYFINEKIPVSERDSIPVIAEGKHILWVVGYRISSYYKITDATKRIIQMTIRREEHGREN